MENANNILLEESFKQDIHKKNVQLRRKNQVSEMNAMKAAIRKHVETANGSIVLNVEELDTNNLKDKVDLGAGINKEIPSTCDAKAEMWIKRKIEQIEYYMDLYKEAKEEYNKTKDWKAKDKMTEYRQIILDSNNFCIDKFNFSPMKLITPNMEEVLMFNQAVRYLVKLINSMSDWNTKSAYPKRREIASFLGSKYGDDVIIQAKAQKAEVSSDRMFVNILLSPRANKVYPDPNNSMFIHFSSSGGLTELDPGIKSNYGDFARFGGKWLYKKPCVHFFAIRMKEKYGSIMNKEKIKSLMEIYGSHIYLYKPKASDKIYFDPMEHGKSGLKAVFIETEKPLPVQELSPIIFQKVNEYNKNKESMIKIKESCLIMDNNEYFFMEASKNPDIKARKRTVNNLRKLGVDRAHEVDNRKINEKWNHQLNELDKKYLNQEISPEDYLKQSKEIKNQMRSLTRNGIDIQIKDSYGKKHKTKLTSNYGGDSYSGSEDTINIDPETMNSNQFYSAFTHEAGHTEQHKRFGDNIDKKDYTTSNTDDYPIKCAKLFLQKNKDKMNSHDAQWTELHADFLAAKKSGFNKQMKDIQSFKRSNKRIKDDIKYYIKHNEEMCERIKATYLQYRADNGEVRTASEKDVEECIKLYKQAKEKIEQYHKILQKRTKDIFDTLMKAGSADTARTDKLVTLYEKASKREKEIASKLWRFEREFEHNGFSVKDALAYGMRMEAEIESYNKSLEDLYAEFTTHDYRIKFLEDMKHIREGHPERCSMKYPPMTPEDKKYMQEFSVEEMFISNIITEAEYVQLQERIQMITERSE